MNSEANTNANANIGFGIGSMIAVCLSWSINQSVWWALIHGIFGWFYIFYSLAGCGH